MMKLTVEQKKAIRDLSFGFYRSYKDMKREYMKHFDCCFWCEIKVREVPHVEGERLPDDMATIDHLKSRFFRVKGERVLKVLACNKCNQDRARYENRKFLNRRLTLNAPADN